MEFCRHARKELNHHDSEIVRVLFVYLVCKASHTEDYSNSDIFFLTSFGRK
jgi:hypothetical protein